MDLFSKINTTMSYVGKTYQEAVDLYANCKGYYYFRNLPGQKEVDISWGEAKMLRVYGISNRSDLFIFNGYGFKFLESSIKDTKVSLTQISKNTSSLGRTLVLQSFMRITKAIVIIAIGIFTFPVWATLLTGASFYNFKQIKAQIYGGFINGLHRANTTLSHFSIPKESTDSYFTADDIVKMGRINLGYRHVSSYDCARSEAESGVNYGCALNISFGPSNSKYDKEIFKGLDQRIQSGEDCNELIKTYNDAITGFIINSIEMDLRGSESLTKITYRYVVNSIVQKSHFLLIKPQGRATDMDQYSGLGRFPKQQIASQNVNLLRNSTLDKLGINKSIHDKEIETGDEFNFLIKHVASYYRKILLENVRENCNSSEGQSLVVA